MENIADLAREHKEIRFQYLDLLACEASDIVYYSAICITYELLPRLTSHYVPASNHLIIGLKSPAYLEIMH